MKAITVRQPWAWAIAYGGKTVENRSQPHPWRSAVGERIAIHAGKGYDEDDLPDVALLATGYGWEDKKYLDVRGAVIATARLTDVHHYELGSQQMCTEWAQPGQWHLVLADVVPLSRPLACRGSLGLWTLPEPVAAAMPRPEATPQTCPDGAQTDMTRKEQR